MVLLFFLEQSIYMWYYTRSRLDLFGGGKVKSVFTVILVLASIVIIGAVAVKEPTSQGLGSSFGSDTSMFDMSGMNAKDALLNRVIVIASAIFVISAILVTAL